ncbi:MAG: LVIVD repeat-containing protein [Candidatus Hodarchaeales archaeon]|jgi:hypothetical protein
MKNRTTLIFGSLIIFFLLQLVIVTRPISGTSETTLTLTKIGQFNLDDGYDVWVDSDKKVAYVTNGYSGVTILDVTTPSSPVELASVPSADIPGMWDGYAHQFLIQEDIIYVGDGIGGLKVINVSDPSNPTVIKQYVDGYAWSARIVGNSVFIPHGYFDVNGEMTVVNITDPANPELIKRCSTDGAATDIEIQENLAFLTTSFAGFTVFDISNHSNPVEVGKWTGQSNNGLESGDLEVIDDLVFLSYWEHGFVILNVSDLANIEVISEINEYQELFSVHIESDRDLAFLSDHEFGLIVLDISDPTHPVEMTRYFDDGGPCMIHVIDDLVYMADQEIGLIILEIVETDLSSQSSTNSSSSSSSSATSIPGFELSLVILVASTIFALRKKKDK